MQIEKIKSPLDLEKGNYKGTEFDIIPADTFVMVCRKINELIDAVNELQEAFESIHPYLKYKDLNKTHADPAENTTDSKMENVAENGSFAENAQEPYAEQRKWIGKLCRFWNFKDGAVDIGILRAVNNLKPTIPYINDIDCSYAFCEPVKSDDDIIYKGEQ